MDNFLMIFSRTELRISVSRVKNCEESFAQVRFCVAPLKPDKNTEKRISESRKFRTEKVRVSKNEMLGIVWNAFCQSFTAVRALFEE